jgi:hypothetical protein
MDFIVNLLWIIVAASAAALVWNTGKLLAERANRRRWERIRQRHFDKVWADLIAEEAEHYDNLEDI